METLLSDLRYSWRTLKKSPAVAAAAIISLGLGIGANTAIFSVASTLLARVLPVAEPARLMAVHRTTQTGYTEPSYPIYEDLRAQNAVFSGVEAHFPLLSLSLAGVGEPRRIWGQLVTGSYFSVLGVGAARGRTFTEAEDRVPDSNPVAVLSYGFWERHFGADARAVGRQITLNNHTFTVIGVAPAGFRGTDLGLAPDIWVPMSMIAQVMPQRPSLADRTAPWLQIYARLKQGVSREQAQAALDVLARRLQETYKKTDEGRGFRLEPASSLHPAYRGAVAGFAGVALAVVGLLLLVACANVANILLARATARRKEIALRIALGASRARLVRQMLTESLLLALGGGAAGLVLSVWVAKLLTAFRLPPPIPVNLEVALDARVLGFTLALALLTGLVFGLVPALRASRPDLVPELKDTALATRSGRFALRDVLVVSQVAISLLLLVVTSLFLRSLGTAWAIDPGFRTDRTLIASFDPRLHGYDDARAKILFNDLQRRIAALPGVRSASVTDIVPLGFGARRADVAADGQWAARAADAKRQAHVFQAAPRYFETMGIPLVRGRDFRTSGERADPVAIVNQTMAQRLWPGQDPIGRRVVRDGTAYEVIGVAANVKTKTLGEGPTACLYLSLEQAYGRDATPFGVSLLVRTESEPARMAAAVTREIHAIDGSLAVFDTRTMAEQVRNALLLARLGAVVFGAFGAVGLLLASVGLYGVVSYSVSRRTREFGIRSAIGARPRDVLRHVLGRGAALAGSGILLGLAAAFALTRFLSSLLYGVSPTDAVAFLGVPLLMMAISLAASYLPARRAANVDPMVALRSE